MHYEYCYVAVQNGVAEDFDILNDRLLDNWEPYAVTWNGGCHIHHLRRKTY